LPSIVKQYQSMARSIESEYAGSDDFTVVVQTFMEDTQLPREVIKRVKSMQNQLFAAKWQTRFVILCARLLPFQSLGTRYDGKGIVEQHA
jgi:hypothetical protein